MFDKLNRRSHLSGFVTYPGASRARAQAFRPAKQTLYRLRLRYALASPIHIVCTVVTRTSSGLRVSNLPSARRMRRNGPVI